ncbi:MAG: hypothetical protein AMJ68_08630 [Acidithiobacillales bacterium SG8_45]|jgi:uncharacterized SAM-binding protein YcdF (DUF218 family)|nr:MAG: hypothetical protein AMJ68_08630 [Acidithiobacillales bacterium SG8_45]
MIFFSDAAQTLLPSVVYFTAILLVLIVVAHRSKTDSLLYRLRYGLVALFLWSYITSTPLFSNFLIQVLEERYELVQASKKDVGPDNLIVVLTSGRVRTTLSGDRAYPDEAGWNRALAAIALWRQIGGTLLFNGGPGTQTGESVAGRMAALARASGVPDKAIIVDGRARDTYENLINTAPYLARAGGRLWLVTSAIHMPRAMAVADRQGIRAIAYPSDFRGNKALGWRGWVPNHNGSKDFERALHELLGAFYYRLRGWI